MANRTAIIYGLVDSARPSEIRYVGKTVVKPSRRLAAHMLCSSRDLEFHYRKSRWIRSVVARNGSIELVVLDECDSSESADRERFWIAELRRSGADLTNMTSGGDGCSDPTPETRRKIGEARVGIPRSAETKQKLSDAHRGRWVGSNNPRYGVPVSDVTRLRQSAAGKARWESPEYRQKQAANRRSTAGEAHPRAQLTESQVLEIQGLIVNSALLYREIAAMYGVGVAAVKAIAQGKTWQHLGFRHSRR